MKLRQIRPLRLPGVAPGGDAAGVPAFKMVDPCTLLVDDTYQRGLTEASTVLIGRIVTDWSWRAFKPPVVVEVERGYHVIDGQHTATAAAMHPGITQIPVMVVRAERAEERADAFVRQNRDRLAVTVMQLHTALVAAGDPEALAVQSVCDEAGVRILKTRPSDGRLRAGETMSVDFVKGLVRHHGRPHALGVVRAVGEAKVPVTALLLRAVHAILKDKDFGPIELGDLTTAMREDPAGLERDAKLFAAEHDVPAWHGMKVVLAKRARQGGRRGRRQAA